MKSHARRHDASRTGLVCISQQCPRIAYLELKVPEEAIDILFVEFTVVSHDQGWADQFNPDDPGERPSMTSFEAHIKPSKSRQAPSSINIGRNRAANKDFFKQSWNLKKDPMSDTDLRKRIWVNSIQPGDTIQLLPIAMSRAWVNFVQEASIKIEYETPKSPELEEPRTARDSDSSVHYAPFKYDAAGKLDPVLQQIRVLVLQPGAFDDPIYGHFETISLSETSVQERADFCALSYCWGTGVEFSDIILRSNHDDEGNPECFSLNVSRTVEQAIRKFRESDKPLRIWIDAVCINQEDDEEKAQQVGMMDRVYILADTVHIWLGGAHFPTELGLRVIRDFYNLHNGYCPVDSQGTCHCPTGSDHTLTREKAQLAWTHYLDQYADQLYNIPALVTKAPSDEKESLGKIISIMETLYTNPWFSRVWVVQEALMSRRALLHCGGQTAPWEQLIDVAERLEEHRNNRRMWWLKTTKLMFPLWIHLRQALESCGPLSPHSAIGLPRILDVFVDALDFKATDPRDKLFALLSFGSDTYLAKNRPDELAPNYQTDEREVFANFTRWWIRKYQSLKVLSCVHLEPSRSWRRTLPLLGAAEQSDGSSRRPTWIVPCEGQSKWKRTLLAWERWNFRATGASIPDDALLFPTLGSSTLQLRGYRVSRIDRIRHPAVCPGEIYTKIPNASPEKLIPGYTATLKMQQEMLDVFEWIFDPSGAHNHWNSGHSFNQWDVFGDPPLEYNDHLRNHWAYLKCDPLDSMRVESNPEKTGTKVHCCRAKLLPSCLDRCYFVASNGMCGLCPWKAREGDVIVLLHGGAVPYLLRRVAEDRGIAGPFEIIGECYVTGIMHGEFFEKLQRAGVRPEIFTLV